MSKGEPPINSFSLGDGKNWSKQAIFYLFG
jgi:hypothetical protein